MLYKDSKIAQCLLGEEVLTKDYEYLKRDKKLIPLFCSKQHMILLKAQNDDIPH